MDGKWTRGEGGSKKAENGWTSFVQAPLCKTMSDQTCYVNDTSRWLPTIAELEVGGPPIWSHSVPPQSRPTRTGEAKEAVQRRTAPWNTTYTIKPIIQTVAQ